MSLLQWGASAAICCIGAEVEWKYQGLGEGGNEQFLFNECWFPTWTDRVLEANGGNGCQIT